MRVALVLAVLVAGSVAAAADPFPDGASNWFGHAPIRIHLDLSNLTEENARFADEARQALRWWEAGGNGRLQWEARFEEVARREDADIILWFRDEARVGPLCLEDERALGCARPFERPVPIEMLARRSDGSYVAYALVREVTKHEVGHAIGFGHSDVPGDVMAPHASGWAAGGWRPGDLPRALAGLAAALVILAGLVLLAWRMLRPRDEVHRLDDPEGECPRARSSRHAFEPLEVDVEGEWQDWQVCRWCRGGFEDKA